MIANLFGLENRTLVVTGVDVRQDSALNKIFGQTSATVAKVNVTEESAQSFSAVYACVRLLSTTVGHLPFNIYKRNNDDGDREIARDSDYYDLLRLQPNPEMTSIFMRQSAMAYTLLWGRHYTYIQRGNNGAVVWLWPMRTGDVRRVIVNGTAYYDVSRVKDNDLYPRPPFGSTELLGRNDIIELTTFDGQSIISHAREQIGESIAAQQFGAGFYAGGAQPYLYLKHPGVLKDPEKLRNNWNAIHSGKERRVAVLEEGMEVGTIGMPLGDAQFLESREFYVTDIARWFGVPPHKIGDLKRATFSNIEEQNLEWRENLLPWLEMIEQEHETKLFTQAERKRFFVEHNTDELLRGNTITRYQAHASALQWGWKSRNEVRRSENLNAIEGGDTYLVPANMVVADDLDEETDDSTNLAEPQTPIDPQNGVLDEEAMGMMENAARSAIAIVVERLESREKAEIRKAISREKNIVEWIDGFYRKWSEKMKAAIRPAVAVASVLGFTAKDDDAINGHCTQAKSALLEVAGRSTDKTLVENVELELNKWNHTPDMIRAILGDQNAERS